MRHTGKIEIRAIALSPIVHGAGTSGNTQLLRTKPVIQPDGTIARVPFVSGNSIKHKLRACAVQYALDVMGVEDHSRTKAEVDLLLSGGHLSKSGAAVDLEQARRIEELFPPLSLCGYSAGNTMTESKIRVSFLNLVCKENAGFVPDDLREHPALKLRAGSMTGEEFGTRHDMANRVLGRRLLTGEAEGKIVAKKSKALKAPKEDGPAERGDSAQMIYEFGAVATGSTWWATIQVADLTELEQAALASAFHYAAVDRRGDEMVMGLGAKNSIGYGDMRIEVRGSMRVAPPEYVESNALTKGDGVAERYREHLVSRKTEILDAIRQAVS